MSNPSELKSSGDKYDAFLESYQLSY